MQLILAIDADRRQADQLAALVRGRLAVELVQATSAGEGLQALAERVPDLIVTSPLLSPFDEGVLAEYLREIGPAGAHVQTLRIPVLSVAKPAGRAMFSFGRKRRTESAPDGCDPTFFADEIAVYLARAAEERQATEASSAAFNVSSDVAPHDVADMYVPAYEPETYTSPAATTDRDEFQWKDETPIYVAPEPTLRDEEVVWEEPEPAANQPEVLADSEPVVDYHDAVAYSEPEPVADLRDTVADSEPEPIPEPQHAPVRVIDEEPEMLASVHAVEDVPVLSPAPSGIDELQVDAKPWDAVGERPPVAAHHIVNEVQSPVVEVSKVEVEPPPSVAPPAPRRTASFEAALAAIRSAWGKTVRSEPAPTSVLFRKHAIEEPPVDSKKSAPTQAQAATTPPAEQPIEDSEAHQLENRGPLEIDLTCDIDALEDPALVEAVGKAERGLVMDDVEDVYELSASPALHDLESDLAAAAPPRVVPHPLPQIEEPTAAPQIEAHEPIAKEKPDKSRKRSNKKAPKKPQKPNTRPAQDEWGLFDPNRCGFAAVVQKLNEVTDEKDPKASRTSVRVISYK